MSFHGGLLGVVIAVWLFCRRHKLKLLADRRSGLRLRADRPVLRAPRQFREWRIVGPRHRCALGDDLSRAAVHLPRHPSQLVRSGAGRHAAVRHPADCAAGLPRPGPAGPDLGASSFWAMAPSVSSANSSASPTRRSSGPVSMGMALSIPVWLAAGVLFAIAFASPGNERA